MKRLFTKTAVILACAFMTSCSLATSTNEQNTKESESVTISFINVGQGDSALVEYGDYDLLIDTGDSANNKALKYLSSREIDDIDDLILTHPHEDHIGNAVKISDKYKVQNVLVPEVKNAGDEYNDLLNGLVKNGAKIKNVSQGKQATIKDMKIDFLSPKEGVVQDNFNNYSIVNRISYKGNSILFTGDMEEIIENDIIGSYNNLQTTILKVAHHGSSTSTNNDFLDAVNPSMAIISVGKNNTYNQPTKEVLDVLDKNEVLTLRTDENGSVVIKLNNDGTINYGSEK